MEDSIEDLSLSKCSLNRQETVVPVQTDFDPFEGLLAKPFEPEWDVTQASGLNLKVYAPKNSGEPAAEKVRDLLLNIKWSVELYGQFWGVELGEDGRMKSLGCEFMPFLIKDDESAVEVDPSEIVDPWSYRLSCKGSVQIIESVEEASEQGMGVISKGKLIDAFTNRLPTFALNEDVTASCCGYKVWLFLPMYDEMLGNVGVLELAVSKAEDTHIVYADFVKGLKATSLKCYDQVNFGSNLFRIFTRVGDEKNKKSIGRKGKMNEDSDESSAEILKSCVYGKGLSNPELATNFLWSGSNSRKRGLSTGGLPPVDRKKSKGSTTLRKPTPGSPFSGQQMVNKISVDGSLVVKIKFSEDKVFVKRIISYASASFAKIQEIAQECLSVIQGTYSLSYEEFGNDWIRLASQQEMQDAIKFASEENNNVIKINVDRS